ncbi:MAG: hypothetical protein KAS11_03875 [Candidatus Aenigmarchaeota archaeon]|nr:hypothetical protein [Candidatus Aenigmarchaeota archaeon]
MGIILFMGAMAVASAVVVMSLGSLDRKDERLEYEGKTISDSMKYKTATKLYNRIEDAMKENLKKRDVLNIQISKGAFNYGYGNKKNAEMTVKRNLKACEKSYKELEIRKNELGKIIEKKEEKMYPTSYASRRPSASGVGF